MNDKKVGQTTTKQGADFFIDRFAYWLALSFVVIGLINVTPAIPGWDELWKNFTGNNPLIFRENPFGI